MMFNVIVILFAVLFSLYVRDCLKINQFVGNVSIKKGLVQMSKLLSSFTISEITFTLQTLFFTIYTFSKILFE